MISAYHTALSGLQASGTRLQSNGKNIANADTDNFKKTGVTNTNRGPQGVKTEATKIKSPATAVFQDTSAGSEPVELSNVNLATEMVDMKLNSITYKANLKTIESVNDMTGSLLKIKS
ncbi:MAG: flagellar basal body rod C-terminal domain-containing protein [Desulforhopalus sp.]